MSTSAAAARVSTADHLKLGRREIYAFASGEVATNLSWNMISGFILFYYSNVARLPIAAVGTLLLITRILDALIDPLIGIAVDRTRTRMGRARPWLLFGGLPFVALTVLTFSVPDWSVNAKLVYAYVTFTLVGIFYSALYVPYNALMPLMTSSPEDKLKLGSLRAVGSSVGSIVIFSSVMPLVDFFGGNDRQFGFTITSIIVSIVTAVMMLAVFRFCRERAHVGRAVRTESIREGVRDMFRNRTWLVVAGLALTMFFRLGSLVSITPYFAIDVLHSPAAIGLLLSSLSVSVLVGGLLAKPYLARFGKRRGNIIALLAGIALSLMQSSLLSYPWLFGALYLVTNLTLGILVTTVFTMIADSVDAQEAQFGSRNEGLLTSTISFAMKVGMAVGGSVIAFGLAIGGYRPDNVDAAARSSITLLYFGAPMLFACMQAIIILFYREPKP